MKIKTLIAVLLLFSVTAFAQQGKEKRDKIKALKVSFITTELNLTSDESAKFWPVYNAFEDKQFELRHKRMRDILGKIDQAGINNLSDKDANNYLNQIGDTEEEMVAIRRKLVADLRPIIGPVKILKLLKAEEDFNRKLISQIRDRKR